MNQAMLLMSSFGMIAIAKTTMLPSPSFEQKEQSFPSQAEVDDENRNVHMLPETGNWKVNKHRMEIGLVHGCALKSNTNHAVVLESTGDETIVPEESPNESGKLMVTSPKLVKLMANQKINGFLPARLQGQLFFQDIFSFSEYGDEFVADES